MTTRMFEALKQKGNHHVGNLNSWKIRTVSNGAIVEGASIDNFTLVELGFNAEGERTCKQLSAVGNKSYLIAAVERRYLGEEMADFYNGVGERVRIVHLDEGIRFDTSAFEKNTGVASIQNGQVAHFDPTKKVYIISAAATPHVDYEKANKKFLVVNSENELVYTNGKAQVRLEVQ